MPGRRNTRLKNPDLYEDLTVPELRKRAKQLGLSNYSDTNKTELVKALRNR